MFRLYRNMGPASDLPAVGDVLDTTTVGGEAGTYTPASVGDVRDGTFYGEDGTEYEGTLEVTGEVSVFFLRRR